MRRWFEQTTAGVWAGIVLIAAGFGLLGLAWNRVASMTDVTKQLPYFVSGGLVGLGLILVGLLVINLSVKRREAIERQRQMEEVRDALVALRETIESLPGDEP